MALLTAYFDESGVHEGDHSCVVAGFVGNDAQWQSFAADWVSAIQPRRNLHMKKLRWNRHPERIAPLLATLGPIPYRYNLKPVAVSVRWNEYNETMKGALNAQFHNPYQMCANACIAVVLLEIAGSDSVYFVFDRQEGLRKETMDIVRDFVFEKMGIDSRVQGIEFLPRTSTVCLDPADYLAFVVRENDIDRNSAKASFGQSILGTTPGHGGRISREQLDWSVRESMERGLDLNSGTKPFPKEAITQLMKNPYWRGPKL